MLIVAERINASRRSIRAAREARDAATNQPEAKSQADSGATYIDVNGGTFPGREPELLCWLVEVVQAATRLPLCLDSPDPAAITAALAKVKSGRPMINSISLEPERLVDRLTRAGVALDDIYVDPLVLPVGVDPQSGLATIEAIGEITRRYPGVHTICGLTNVSHGLPARALVNRTFLVAAMTRGLDAVIVDPTDAKLMTALKAAEALLGRDEY
jgi:5-methyltetrahydrofolate--homocysteine methyltransferase